MVAVTDPGTRELFLSWETPEQLVGGAEEICTVLEQAPLCTPCLLEQPRVQPGCAAVHGTLGAQGGQGPTAAAEWSPGRGQHLLGGSAAVVSPQQEPVLCVHQEGGHDPGRAAT